MTPDLLGAIAQAGSSVDAEDLEELLAVFRTTAGDVAADSLRRGLAEQVLRAIEVSLLADPAILDIALNPGLYLGRERDLLTTRLTELLGAPPPTELVRHVRALVLSKAAGASKKASLAGVELEVLRRHRLKSLELRCADCGYHFVQQDLGQSRLDMLSDLGFVLAEERLARRLRDPWKPATATGLTIDHTIPEAGLGPTDPDNLRVSCKFCNAEKRIYRWPGEPGPRDVAASLLALGDVARGLWAVRAATYVAIVSGGGGCAECGKSKSEGELTGRPHAQRGRAPTTPWTMTAACYDCYDPAA